MPTRDGSTDEAFTVVAFDDKVTVFEDEHIGVVVVDVAAVIKEDTAVLEDEQVGVVVVAAAAVIEEDTAVLEDEQVGVVVVAAAAVMEDTATKLIVDFCSTPIAKKMK